MNLSLLFSTVSKHRRLLAAGLFLGFAVLALTSYKINFDYRGFESWPLHISPRTDKVYETSISLAVDSPKFGMGRAGLSSGSWPAFSRSVELAPTYSYMASSDFLKKRIESEVGSLADNEQVTSETIEKTPIILVRVQGDSPQRARDIIYAVVGELKDYIKETQQIENTPRDDRIIIRQMGPANEPIGTNRFQSVKLSLAFLSPTLLALAMAFLIENIESSPYRNTEREQQKDRS